MMSNYHAPVMPVEVEAFLCPTANKIIMDGTVGGGGHTEIFLRGGAEVIAFDRDPDALAHCEERFTAYQNRLTLVQSNFCEAPRELDKLNVEKLDGVLLDLGISSHQIDTSERGFSFQKDGPLDMRMNQQGEEVSAAILVNTASEEELERIFHVYGNEPRAARIARGLVARRAEKPFFHTGDLATTVEKLAPRTSAKHPATRVFQALRIAVNDEMVSLVQGLERISSRLASGAPLAVISFHSTEDRIVKRFFREHSTAWIDRPEWPEPRRNPDCIFKILTPKPIEASAPEVLSNPRARSAKLRVASRL